MSNVVNLIKDPKNGGFLVTKNGEPTRCANLAPFPTQDQFGGIAMIFVPCATTCPKCNVVDDILLITCCGTENRFQIEERKEEKLTILQSV